MKKSNIFADLPTSFKEEVFEEIISKKDLKLERIISKGHTTKDGEWYDQVEDEWVMLLKGEAVLEFENSSSIRLKEGDYINIPAKTKHRVSWTSLHVETIWLALHH